MSAPRPIEHTARNHPRGGPAATTESLKIESFNVIARTKALHRAWKANFADVLASIFVEFPNVHMFGIKGLTVIACENHTQLEEVVKYFLARGLNMTRDGAFEDFAIVHGTHGIPMPCTWLDYQRDGDGATVSLKPERNFLEFGWSDSGYEGPGWMAARGHGFVLSQEKDYDVWIDFTTGGTVVSLRRPEPLSAMRSAEQTSA